MLFDADRVLSLSLELQSVRDSALVGRLLGGGWEAVRRRLEGD
jgi:hypothetical protein